MRVSGRQAACGFATGPIRPQETIKRPAGTWPEDRLLSAKETARGPCCDSRLFAGGAGRLAASGLAALAAIAAAAITQPGQKPTQRTNALAAAIAARIAAGLAASGLTGRLAASGLATGRGAAATQPVEQPRVRRRGEQRNRHHGHQKDKTTVHGRYSYPRNLRGHTKAV